MRFSFLGGVYMYEKAKVIIRKPVCEKIGIDWTGDAHADRPLQMIKSLQPPEGHQISAQQVQMYDCRMSNSNIIGINIQLKLYAIAIVHLFDTKQRKPSHWPHFVHEGNATVQRWKKKTKRALYHILSTGQAAYTTLTTFSLLEMTPYHIFPTGRNPRGHDQVFSTERHPTEHLTCFLPWKSCPEMALKNIFSSGGASNRALDHISTKPK